MKPEPWTPRELQGLRIQHNMTDHDRHACPICRFLATLDQQAEAMAEAAMESEARGKVTSPDWMKKP